MDCPSTKKKLGTCTKYLSERSDMQKRLRMQLHEALALLNQPTGILTKEKTMRREEAGSSKQQPELAGGGC